MRRARHIACIVRKLEMNITYWWVNQKERDHYENLDIGRRILFRWILEKYDGRMGQYALGSSNSRLGHAEG
jgi:hypothetical protein